LVERRSERRGGEASEARVLGTRNKSSATTLGAIAAGTFSSKKADAGTEKTVAGCGGNKGERDADRTHKGSPTRVFEWTARTGDPAWKNQRRARDYDDEK
jgi:hypothetical protein